MLINIFFLKLSFFLERYQGSNLDWPPVLIVWAAVDFEDVSIIATPSVVDFFCSFFELCSAKDGYIRTVVLF